MKMMEGSEHLGILDLKRLKGFISWVGSVLFLCPVWPLVTLHLADSF